MPLDHERPASETIDLADAVAALNSKCPENPHCKILGKDYQPWLCNERVCPRRDNGVSPWAFKLKPDKEQG